MPRTVCKNEGCRGLIAANEIGYGSRCPPCKAKYLARRDKGRREAAMRAPCIGRQCRATVRKREHHVGHEGFEEWTGRCWSCEMSYRAEQESLHRQMVAAENREQEANNELAFYMRLKDMLNSHGVYSVHDVLNELLTHIIERKTR